MGRFFFTILWLTFFTLGYANQADEKPFCSELLIIIEESQNDFESLRGPMVFDNAWEANLTLQGATVADINLYDEEFNYYSEFANEGVLTREIQKQYFDLRRRIENCLDNTWTVQDISDFEEVAMGVQFVQPRKKVFIEIYIIRDIGEYFLEVRVGAVKD